MKKNKLMVVFDLYSFRLKHGYTYQSLADKSDIDPAVLCHIENGKRQPRLAQAKRLAEIFGTTIDSMTSWPKERH